MRQTPSPLVPHLLLAASATTTLDPPTPHERGPEPVVSIAFCDMSQNVTKRRLTQPVVAFSPVVESEKLEITEIIYCQTGFAVSFGLD